MTGTITIGIDPGINGALAAINSKGEPVAVWDMPTLQQTAAGGREVDVVILAAQLDLYPIDSILILEKVHSMPKMGVTSAFRFGETFGAVKGIAAGLGMQLELVTPQEWKKRAGLTGTKKDECRKMCIRMYPDIKGRLKRKRDIDRADAIMIGIHGKK